MTLKEKFVEQSTHIRYQVLETEKFEKIADDYAIEFAEWLYRWDNIRLPNGNWIIGSGLKAYTSEEVLVKFKKEKGL